MALTLWFVSGLAIYHEKRDVLEKRDWVACVSIPAICLHQYLHSIADVTSLQVYCMAACGLLQNGISLLSTSQQVQLSISRRSIPMYHFSMILRRMLTCMEAVWVIASSRVRA